MNKFGINLIKGRGEPLNRLQFSIALRHGLFVAPPRPDHLIQLSYVQQTELQ